MSLPLSNNVTAAYGNIQQSQGIGANGSSNVVGAIQQASARTGVNFAYLLNKADQESGMNPAAKASTSSASGLFQFINATWLNMVKQHGAEYGLTQEANAITMKNGKPEVSDPALKEKILNMRNDPVLSSVMAAEFTRDNKDYLEAKVGGTIGSTELYMAHFLGASGASTFLNALHGTPNASGADLLPAAAAANKTVFYGKDGRALSLQAIYDHFAAHFSGDSGNALTAQNNNAPSSPASAAPLNNFLNGDLASLSSYLYAPPATAQSPQDMLDVLHQNSDTSSTLLNAMIIAQNAMTNALKFENGSAANAS